MVFFKRYRLYILLSLLIHIIIVVGGVYLGYWSNSKPENSNKQRVIQAMIIDPHAIERQAETIRNNQAQQQAVQQKLQQEQAQKEEKEQAEREQQQKEQEKLEQEKIEKEKIEQEKQRLVLEKKQQEEKAQQEALEKERIRQEQEKKAEQERIAQEKALQEEQQRKAEQERLVEQQRKAEQERLAEEKRIAEEKAKQETPPTDEFDDLFADIDLSAEVAIPKGVETGRNEAGSAKSKAVLTELNAITFKYEQLVKQNLRNSASFSGKSCFISFRLAHVGMKGLVNDQSITSDNANEDLCREAINAVKRINEFPLSKDPDVNRELITIKMNVDL